MVAFILYGMSVVESFSDDYGVSDNASSTCVLEQSLYPSSCVIVGFPSNFTLFATLKMAAVRERLLLVGGSDITYDTTS